MNEFVQALKWHHWKFVCFNSPLNIFFFSSFYVAFILWNASFLVGTRWLPAERELLFLYRTSKRLTGQLRSLPSVSQWTQPGGWCWPSKPEPEGRRMWAADLTRNLAKIIEFINSSQLHVTSWSSQNSVRKVEQILSPPLYRWGSGGSGTVCFFKQSGRCGAPSKVWCLLWHHQHSLYRIESTAGWLVRVEGNGTCVAFIERAGKVGKGRVLPNPWRFLLLWPGNLFFSMELTGWKWLAVVNGFCLLCGKWRFSVVWGGSGNDSRVREPDDLNLEKINGIVFRQLTVPSEPCGSTEGYLPASFAHVYRTPILRNERILSI